MVSGFLASLKEDGSRRYEAIIILKDGSPVPLDMFINEFGGDGEFYCYYSFIADIVERKKMEDMFRQNRVNPDKVDSIEADVTQICYDFTAGGLYGTDKEIRTKEQADHSLAYLLAVALLDGDVMPAQFEPDRIIRADVQRLLKRVTARPNPEYTGNTHGKCRQR